MKYYKKGKKKFFKKLNKNSLRKLRKRRPAIKKKKKIPEKSIPNERCLFQTPYNSNEYLIQNHSTPFFDENEEESIGFFPIDLTNLTPELNGLLIYKNESTNEDTEINKEYINDINKIKNESKKLFY